jgi:hypothetical protein
MMYGYALKINFHADVQCYSLRFIIRLKILNNFKEMFGLNTEYKF